MNKKQKKAFEEAYDKVYDLNSAYGQEYIGFLDSLEKEVYTQGYKFYLNQNNQKFKLKKVLKNV